MSEDQGAVQGGAQPMPFGGYPLESAGIGQSVHAQLRPLPAAAATMQMCALAKHPLQVLASPDGSDGLRPYAVQCVCGESGRWEVPLPAELERVRKLARILTDLDRCEHGRHRIDSCVSCPGGISAGNPHMPDPGRPVGYDLRGEPYFVPSGERGDDPLCSTSDPMAWRRDGREAMAAGPVRVFRERPDVPVVLWNRNGDHPGDGVGELAVDPVDGSTYRRVEGLVVRFFRHPDVPGESLCPDCALPMDVHGWVDSGVYGQTVHPGDWVTTS
jgi:hypothetical protein